MLVRAEANIPLVIGSAGICGADHAVDWLIAITREIAMEIGQGIRLAILKSGQPASRIKTALSRNQIKPLEPVIEINSTSIEDCTNIVALAGAE